MQGLTNVRARALFQATDLVVTVLTAGPNTVAPACCTTASWPAGLSPARRVPRYSSCPWVPSTISAAMPTMMPISGCRARSVSTARSVARKSASPAAPAVSKLRPSAPASQRLSAT